MDETIEKQPNIETKEAEVHISKSRSGILWGVTFLLICLGLLYGIYWFLYLQHCQSTDDAYADGNLVSIHSAVSGSVVAFYADDTDLVKEGQLLVLLDRTDYQLNYEKELAKLAATVLQVKQLYDTVFTNRDNVENKQAVLKRVNFDFENRSKLVASKAISNEDFVHAQDDLTIAKINLKQAESQLQVSIDAAGSTPMEKHPLIEQQKGNVRTAYVNLQRCSVYAPVTGYIAQRTVDVGQWVNPSVNMMAVVPKNYMWVNANFKETQLKSMRIGQPASLWFDLYGSDVTFEGKVLGISSGTGSAFSLLPPQNATGNWIKIVQRLPVRIGIDLDKMKQHPLRVGLSATVYVDTTNKDLPFLALEPSKRVISETSIYDIPLDAVNKIMDEMIGSAP